MQRLSIHENEYLIKTFALLESRVPPNRNGRQLDITGQTTHRENAPMELALFSAFLHPEYFNPKKLFQSASNARGEYSLFGLVLAASSMATGSG